MLRQAIGNPQMSGSQIGRALTTVDTRKQNHTFILLWENNYKLTIL